MSILRETETKKKREMRNDEGEGRYEKTLDHLHQGFLGRGS